MHAFFSEVVHKSSLPIGKVSPHDYQVSSHRCMCEKLPHKGIAIGMSFGKQEDSRGEAIDAMHDEDSLPAPGEML